MFEHVKPLDPKAEKRKRVALVAIPLLAILAGALYYEFKNYPEERAVKQFLAALQKQDYQGAYRLWQPSKYYTFENFSQDWGPNGVEGPIRDFSVANSHEKGSGVLIDVKLNGQKEISLWVEKADKSLSFPP